MDCKHHSLSHLHRFSRWCCRLIGKYPHVFDTRTLNAFTYTATRCHLICNIPCVGNSIELITIVKPNLFHRCPLFSWMVSLCQVYVRKWAGSRALTHSFRWLILIQLMLLLLLLLVLKFFKIFIFNSAFFLACRTHSCDVKLASVSLLLLTILQKLWYGKTSNVIEIWCTQSKIWITKATIYKNISAITNQIKKRI